MMAVSEDCSSFTGSGASLRRFLGSLVSVTTLHSGVGGLLENVWLPAIPAAIVLLRASPFFRYMSCLRFVAASGCPEVDFLVASNVPVVCCRELGVLTLFKLSVRHSWTAGSGTGWT